MSQPTTLRASQGTILWNKVKTFFSKPHNVILLLLGIVLTFTTVAPIVAIVEDTFKILLETVCEGIVSTHVANIFAEKEKITEELKGKDQLKWVGLMNNIKHSAEEIILKEYIFINGVK